MKKLKILLIVVGVLVIGYFGFKLFLGPDGHTSETDLVNSFIENLSSSDVCETHFNEETQSNCLVVVDTIKDEDVTVVSIDITNDSANVVIEVNGNRDTFMFVFIQSEVSGLKGYFYSSYYLIDYLY